MKNVNIIANTADEGNPSRGEPIQPLTVYEAQINELVEKISKMEISAKKDLISGTKSLIPCKKDILPLKKQKKVRRKKLDGYTVHVGNLKYDIDNNILFEFFRSKCYSVKKVNVKKGKGKLNRGFGYVDFSTKLGYLTGLKQNGKILCGRPLKVTKKRY